MQVLVPGALVAVVRYGQARQWKLAEAAPHDDLSAGSFSGGATAQGHQGFWVAQQVCFCITHFASDADGKDTHHRQHLTHAQTGTAPMYLLK